ncbi:MAG: hypothetical protein IKW39_00650 [Alphaproteobacteria bacterium]|nr:hypothetical protein [Alphaproteobacteria bacterium]
MKKVIFNYFFKKCIEKQQALLGVSFKEACLSLIMSHTSLVHRTVHGVSTEEIIKTNRYFVEELFLIMCFEASRKGHDLFGYFDFHNESSYRQGDLYFDHIEDTTLDKYLEEIFPAVKNKAEIPYHLYEKLTGISSEELVKKSHRVDNLCHVNIAEFKTTITCKETGIVDDTWEHLMADEKFVTLFTSKNKHTPCGLSTAVSYLKEYYPEELKQHVR